MNEYTPIDPLRAMRVKASLPHNPSNEAIINAMVARLGRAYDAYHKAEVPSGKGGLSWSERTAKKGRAIKEILNDPYAKSAILAKRAEVHESTIQYYRRCLKAEGRIR